MKLNEREITRFLNIWISFEQNTSQSIESFMAYIAHRVFSHYVSLGRASWVDGEIPFIIEFVDKNDAELRNLFEYVILYDGPRASEKRSRKLVEEFVSKSAIFETMGIPIKDLGDIIITEGNDNIIRDRDQFFNSERKRVAKRHRKRG